MKNKLVSIITPSYKSERFISQIIESVLAQTYQDWKILYNRFIDFLFFRSI